MMDKQQQHEYKSRLLELRTRLMREVATSEEAMRQDVLAPGEISTLPTHPADMAAEGLDKEIAIAHNEECMLEDVEAALMRIEAGSFGMCQDCGKEITKTRLEALPYAQWCIKCARRHGAELERPA